MASQRTDQTGRRSSNYRESRDYRENRGARDTRRPAQSKTKKQPAKIGANAKIMRAMVVTLIVMTLVVCVLAFLAFSSGSDSDGDASIDNTPLTPVAADDRMAETLASDNIYDFIYVNGVDVGGLSVSDAQALLYEELVVPLLENTIDITYENTRLTYTYEDFAVGYDIEKALDEAYNYARLGLDQDRYAKIIDLQTTPLEITAAYSFDPNAVTAAVAALGEYIVFEFKNASMRRENGQFIVTPESSGDRLDIEATSLNVADLLHNKQSGTVEATVSSQQPALTSAMFMSAQSLLGSYKTVAAAGDANRDQNIANAASKINNVVVLPGEIFSTNEAFGEMTYDNGYREGNVIIGGEFEKQIGGGVCQISSTLYVALVHAELRIVERQNHSLKVGYVDYAYDATLAGTYIDLKFENNTEYPVLIESYMNGRDVFVNIYGHETRPAGREIRLSNNLIETFPPPEDIETEDDTLPLGFREEDKAPRTGYRYELIKNIYQDGAYVSSSRVNLSTYRATAAEVRVGTNPDIPWPADEPPPQQPTDPGDTPTEPGDTPTDPGDTPVDPGDTPADPGDTPADPGDTPVDPGDTPTNPGDTPTDPVTEPDPEPEPEPEPPSGPPADWPAGIPWNPSDLAAYS